MRVEFTKDGIREKGDTWYAIQGSIHNNNTVYILPICITKEVEQKFAAAKMLLIMGVDRELSNTKVAATWPQKWKYLNKELRQKLWSKGIHLKRRRYLMLTALPIEDMGPYSYLETNLSDLLDAWLEIIFHEFALESEIKRFKEDYPLQKNPSKPYGPQMISVYNAKAWIILQNALYRLGALWECLMRQVLPLYIRGEALEKSKDKDWKRLDSYITGKINKQQEDFYIRLREANDEWVNHSKTKSDNLLKILRDTVSHSISPRPNGVFPPANPPPQLPDEIGKLHELIEIERSHLYEAILLMCGLIRHKTPVNEALEQVEPRTQSPRAPLRRSAWPRTPR